MLSVVLKSLHIRSYSSPEPLFAEDISFRILGATAAAGRTWSAEREYEYHLFIPASGKVEAARDYTVF